MKNVGFKIITDFERPDKALIERFKNIPVANIDDGMNRTAAVCHAIRPMNKAPLCGPAFTIRVPHGDNLMFHKAMDMAKPGDIIVIDAGGFEDRAIFGSLMIHYCRARKLGGVIVDGAIRDSEEIAEMDFPVYARAITPNGPYKNGPGEINTTISFGGVVVNPGDIIVGDMDGVIVIKPEDAEYAAQKGEEIVKKEAGLMEGILKGEYIRPWVDELIDKLGCEIIEK